MATKVEDVHIIWIVEGLGCEGDTIAVSLPDTFFVIEKCI